MSEFPLLPFFLFCSVSFGPSIPIWNSTTRRERASKRERFQGSLLFFSIYPRRERKKSEKASERFSPETSSETCRKPRRKSGAPCSLFGFHQRRGPEHALLAGFEVESRAEEAKNKRKKKQPASMPLFFFLHRRLASSVARPFRRPAAFFKKKKLFLFSSSSPLPPFPKSLTLQQESLSGGTLGEPRLQRPALAGEDQRRQARDSAAASSTCSASGYWAAGRRSSSSTSRAPRSRGGPPTW